MFRAAFCLAKDDAQTDADRTSPASIALTSSAQISSTEKRRKKEHELLQKWESWQGKTWDRRNNNRKWKENKWVQQRYLHQHNGQLTLCLLFGKRVKLIVSRILKLQHKWLPVHGMGALLCVSRGGGGSRPSWVEELIATEKRNKRLSGLKTVKVTKKLQIKKHV